MAEKNFAITPSVSISRSKFLRTNTHKTAFKLGEIVPLYVDEVLPGDTRSIDVASLVRMSTPVVPIMDDIEMELFAFFVPNRIVWNDWKEFMGESPTAGYSAWNGTFPYSDIGASGENLSVETVGDYMGLPTGSALGAKFPAELKVSALPLRGYLAIYNRWFRDQNVEAPIFIDTTDGEDSSDWTYGDACLISYKKSDYFTRALPYAQKGAPVTLPLGSVAPLKVGADYSIGDITMKSSQVVYAEDEFFPLGAVDGDLVTNNTSVVGPQTNPVDTVNLYADLSKATAATINQIREAFQLQKLLEKDALYGTRYWEILYGHFGVRSPDATLQDPEYLGGTRFMINVEQVLQTTGYNSTPGSNTLGTPGANSVTGDKGSLFTKSFVEHGYLFILGVARQRQHTYGQRLDRSWTRFDRYDYYWPEFANLGAQEIKKKELFCGTDAFNADGSDKLFGYQEAWADYRYKPSLITSKINPALSNNLAPWSLADVYSSAPSLTSSFLQESRSNLSRCLVTGDTGPDFIADFYFRDVAVRPLPVYSIPGLVDHH